jgi:hypothetical protein
VPKGGGGIYPTATNQQKAIQYIYWPKYIPKGLRIFQPYSFQDPPKFTQIRVLGLKIYYHLATLGSWCLFLPLVRVEVEGVDQLDAVEDGPVLGADEGAAGVGGVHVQPDVLSAFFLKTGYIVMSLDLFYRKK